MANHNHECCIWQLRDVTCRIFARSLSHISHQLLVALPSLLSRFSNFACTFLHQHLHPLPANPFIIIEINQWQPVVECHQIICNHHLQMQGSISNLIQMVLPPDTGPMLLLQKPSYRYFLPLVEYTIVGLPYPFGKLLHREFHLLQADWGFAFCTAQVQQIVALIICIIIAVGHLRQWRQLYNHCDIWFPQFLRRLESFCWEANQGYSRCARKWFRWWIRARRYWPIDWMVFRRSWRHSR